MPKKFKTKKPVYKDAFICIRGFLVEDKKLRGVKPKDRFVAFMRDAKTISASDLKRRMEYSKGVK
jgi:hypothetical protein